MSELLNPGILNLASLAVSVALLLVGLLLWFFVNRASSRANEQIELLQLCWISKSGRMRCYVACAKPVRRKKRTWSSRPSPVRRKGRMSLSAWWQSAKYLDRCASYDAHLHDSGR